MITTFTLFCLPHAGGSKYAYKPFVDAAPPFVKVIPLEYPGRGERIEENLILDAEALARQLVSEIRTQLNKPYAIYGHSMGTMIGLLMVREIKAAGYEKPKFLFFTGSGGPSTRVHEKIRHLLPESELIEELRSLGGVSEEVLNEPDIMNFFLPVIRADFQAIETYHYAPAESLDIPINVAIGTEESVTTEEARSWQDETRLPVEIMEFQGKHFFIFDHLQRIMKVIEEKILE